MKKSKKFLIALSSSLIISAATIPASIYCIIKNKNSWIQKYNNSRESAEKLINLINKMNIIITLQYNKKMTYKIF